MEDVAVPAIITLLLAACFLSYALILLIEVLRTRRWKRFLLEFLALLAVAGLLHVTTGFPEPSRTRAFGGLGPLPAISLMFPCVLLGMAARYVFYLRGTFSWLSFLRPLCISPIVLLPLLGALAGTSRVEPIQLVSFSILAFQNGFFWRVVFEQARPRT
jgi:hypothetical protein